MRILVSSMNFSPELTGIGKYSGEMAAWLAQRGHEVRVVCAPPYYPQWRVDPPHSALRYRVENPTTGVKVWRCPLWVPRKLSGGKRLLHLASFALSSFPVMLRQCFWRPDVVLAVSPAFFGTPAGWLSARLCGAKAWLHVQDLEVDAAFEMGLLKGGTSRRFVLMLERWMMRRFDMVSTISDKMRERLADKGLAREKLAMCQNWVDIAAIRPLADPREMRRALGIGDEKVVCLFSGSINRKQGLHTLVEAARLLADQADVLIVICGNGEFRAVLEAQAEGLANLRFIDLQPVEQLNALLNMADLHLLPQLRGAADLVMPSKLGGMLASGRPVIAGAEDGTEIAAVVCERGCIVEPENAAAFAQAMRTLAADAARRAVLGAAARRYAEECLDRERIMQALECQLASVS
jgi:colanic acid biosynthesis glycosyl transferase WcaI